MIKTLACPPRAGVDTHGRDTQLIGEFKRVGRAGDIGLTLCLVGADETLVCAQADEWQAGMQCLAFDFTPIGWACVFAHLHFQHFDAIKPHPCGLFN